MKTIGARSVVWRPNLALAFAFFSVGLPCAQQSWAAAKPRVVHRAPAHAPVKTPTSDLPPIRTIEGRVRAVGWNGHYLVVERAGSLDLVDQTSLATVTRLPAPARINAVWLDGDVRVVVAVYDEKVGHAYVVYDVSGKGAAPQRISSADDPKLLALAWGSGGRVSAFVQTGADRMLGKGHFHSDSEGPKEGWTYYRHIMPAMLTCPLDVYLEHRADLAVLGTSCRVRENDLSYDSMNGTAKGASRKLAYESDIFSRFVTEYDTYIRASALEVSHEANMFETPFLYTPKEYLAIEVRYNARSKTDVEQKQEYDFDLLNDRGNYFSFPRDYKEKEGDEGSRFERDRRQAHPFVGTAYDIVTESNNKSDDALVTAFKQFCPTDCFERVRFGRNGLYVYDGVAKTQSVPIDYIINPLLRYSPDVAIDIGSARIVKASKAAQYNDMLVAIADVEDVFRHYHQTEPAELAAFKVKALEGAGNRTDALKWAQQYIVTYGKGGGRLRLDG